jgi:SSS family solute:Na+ symporter
MLEAFDYSLFMAMLAVLSVLYLILGYRASGPIEDHEDYLLSGRSLSTFALTMTIVATQLGGGTLLGSAEEAYRSGWPVLLYPLGSCLGLLFLATGFGARMRAYRFSTVSEVFESIYKSLTLRRLSSILSMVSLFIILVAQGIAARKFLHSLGCYSHWVYLAGWAVLIAYTVAGGLSAVVNTDIIQALFILAACSLVLFLIPSFESVQLPSLSASMDLSFISSDISWSSWLWMPFCFMLIEQDIGQRLFAAKSSTAIRRACLFSCLIMLAVTFIPIFLGNMASQLNLTAPEDSSILLTAVSHITSKIPSTIFACAILMAIMSTADSLLCSIISNLAFDFPLGKGCSQARKLLIAKMATLITGLIGILSSYLFNNVLSVLIFSYELSVAILFVPVVIGFLDPSRAHKQEAWASCLCSGSVYLAGLFFTFPIAAVWMAMIAGLLSFTFVRLARLAKLLT